jgi:hypothetical protein
MQHRERSNAKAGKRAAIVEVADERDDAVEAELAYVVAIARQADQPDPMPQEIRDPQGDITATHQQQSLRHDPSG